MFFKYLFFVNVGIKFVNAVINELVTLWHELAIVHGKPRHSQSQGSVKKRT